MVISSDKKRVLNIILTVVMVMVLLTGVGLGVFFILKDKNELSLRQKNFGANVNLVEKNVLSEEINLDLSISLDLSESIVLVNDDYALVNGETKDKIFSVSSNEEVIVNPMIVYDEVETLCGKYAIVSSGGIYKLIDLTTGDLVFSLEGAKWNINGDYLVVKSVDGSPLKYYPNNSEDRFLAVVINTKTRDFVLEINQIVDIIDINVSVNWLTVVYLDKTEIYNLNNFAHEKTIDNVGERNSTKYNIISGLNNKTYLLDVYHRVYELSKNVLLIEKAERVSADDYSVKSELSDGSKQEYKISYKIYDAVSKEFYEVDNDNCILKPIQVNLGDDYFAILEYAINAQKEINNDSVKISYYEFDTNKNNIRKIYKIISYDYLSNGLISGFDGRYLLTTGGKINKPISFKGEETKKFNVREDVSLSATNNKNVLIETSIIGQKRVINNKGEILISSTFSNISPFVGNYAIAKGESNYYRISASGEKEVISNFAEELIEYVFLGIGMYFTTVSEGVYNVYNFNGGLIYSSVGLEFNYNDATDELLVCIKGDSQKLILLKPIKTKENSQFKNPTGVYSVTSGNEVKDFSGSKKSFVTEDKLEPISTNVDETYGYGFSTFKLNLLISDVESKFISYSELTNEQKLMIPNFDDGQAKSYVSGTDVFVFDGVYFVSGDSFVIAVIRLNNNNEKSYMVNIAFNDVYLKTLKTTYNNGVVANAIYSDEVLKADIDASERVLPAISLKGTGLIFGEEQKVATRIVDYKSFGYDGGVIIATESANLINLEFVLSNIYFGKDFDTGYLDLSGLTMLDFDKYTIKLVNAENKYLEVKAKEGYFITGLNVVLAKKSTSVFDKFHVIEDSGKVTSLCTSYQIDLNRYLDVDYVRINNLQIVERYAKINFVNYNNEIIDSVYYFNGYGEDLTADGNPAYFGFKDFNRKTKIEVPEYRVGYVFNGYGSGEELIVDKNGNLIGKPSLNINFLMNQVQVINVYANYTPKQFTIYFTNDEEPLSGEEIEVVFDSQIGQMPTVSKIGYDFVGWQDVNGEIFNPDTIYNVDNHITLSSKWKAEEYDLLFDANFNGYDGLEINGYDYLVGSAQFTKSFKSFNVGDRFNKITKTITYDQLYGDMPQILGYNSKDDIYMFLGWYENSDPLNKGAEYTNSNKVTIDSARTLYAHYTKEIYSIKIEVNNDFLDKLKEIKCIGATSEGVSSTFSTVSGNAEQLLVFVDNQLVLYTLQSKRINIGVDLLHGYHIEEMQVDYAGESYYFDKSALSPSYKGNNFTDTEDVSGNITASATIQNGYSLNVGLTMTEGQAASDYDAVIKLVAAATKYTVNISTNVEGYKSSEDDLYLYKKDGTDDDKELAHGFSPSGSISGTSSQIAQTIIKFAPKITENAEGGVNIQNSYLEKLEIKYKNGLYEKYFKLNYRQPDGGGKYYNYLESDKATGSWERTDSDRENNDVEEKWYQAKEVNFITLIVRYDPSKNIYYYACTFDKTIDSNIEIKATFKVQKSDVTVKSSPIGYADEGVVSLIENNISVPPKDLRPTDSKSFQIQAKPNALITSINVKYGDSASESIYFNENIFFWQLSIFNKEGEPLRNNTDHLNICFGSGTNKTLDSTNVTFKLINEIQNGSPVYKIDISIHGIVKDIEIDVKYVQYRMIVINDQFYDNTDGSERGNRLSIITAGGGAINTDPSNDQLDNISFYVENITNLTNDAVVVNRNGSDGKSKVYLVFGKEAYLNGTISVRFNEDSGYKRDTDRQLTDDDDNIVEEDNVISIDKDVYELWLTAGSIERNLQAAAFQWKHLEGGDLFERVTGLSSGGNNYKVECLNENKESVAIHFNSEVFVGKDGVPSEGVTVLKSSADADLRITIPQYITFAGSSRDAGFVIDESRSGLYLFKNNLDSALLKSFEGLSVVNGNYTFTYEFDSDISKKDFRFYVYYDVFQYEIKYKASILNGSVITDSDQLPANFHTLTDQLVTYGVEMQLHSTDRVTKTGYDFCYYSQTAGGGEWKGSGVNIVGDAVKLIDHAKRGDFEDSDHDNVYEYIVYLVYKPKTYTIIFNTDNTEGETTYTKKVTFDTNFGDLPTPTKTGYSFSGWWTSRNSGNEQQVLKITVLDVFLYNKSQVNESSNTITLQAKWEKNVYIIRYDSNGGSSVFDEPEITIGDDFPTVTTTKTGYDFDGWYWTNEDGEQTEKAGERLDKYFLNAIEIVEDTTGAETKYIINLTAGWKASTKKYNFSLRKYIFDDVEKNYKLGPNSGILKDEYKVKINSSEYNEEPNPKLTIKLTFGMGIFDQIKENFKSILCGGYISSDETWTDGLYFEFDNGVTIGLNSTETITEDLLVCETIYLRLPNGTQNSRFIDVDTGLDNGEGAICLKDNEYIIYSSNYSSKHQNSSDYSSDGYNEYVVVEKGGTGTTTCTILYEDEMASHVCAEGKVCEHYGNKVLEYTVTLQFDIVEYGSLYEGSTYYTDKEQKTLTIELNRFVVVDENGKIVTNASGEPVVKKVNRFYFINLNGTTECVLELDVDTKKSYTEVEGGLENAETEKYNSMKDNIPNDSLLWEDIETFMNTYENYTVVDCFDIRYKRYEEDSCLKEESFKQKCFACSLQDELGRLGIIERSAADGLSEENSGEQFLSGMRFIDLHKRFEFSEKDDVVLKMELDYSDRPLGSIGFKNGAKTDYLRFEFFGKGESETVRPTYFDFDNDVVIENGEQVTATPVDIDYHDFITSSLEAQVSGGSATCNSEGRITSYPWLQFNFSINMDLTIGTVGVSKTLAQVVCYYDYEDENGDLQKGSEIMQIEQGETLENKLKPVFRIGYKFVGWHECNKEGTALQSSIINPSEITIDNIWKTYAYYAEYEELKECNTYNNPDCLGHTGTTCNADAQLVKFFVWKELGYVESKTYSLSHKSRGNTYTSGDYSNYFTGAKLTSNDGRVNKMPSPSEEFWPAGTYFAGYIIKNSAPASGYYTTHDITSQESVSSQVGAVFDYTSIVDRVIYVYAMYDEYKFSVSPNWKGHGGGLPNVYNKIDVTISFGDILDNGSVVHKYDASEDVNIVEVNGHFINQYVLCIQNGYSREAAFEKAYGYSALCETYFTSCGRNTLAYNDYFYMAVVMKNKNDGSYGYNASDGDVLSDFYIYAVSDNFIKYNDAWYSYVYDHDDVWDKTNLATGEVSEGSILD